MRVHHKIAFVLLKYIPIIIFLLMWFGITCSTFLFIELIFIDIIVGCAILPSILILSLSKIFNFCWVHKSLTVYSMFTDFIINLNKYIGLGVYFGPLKYLLIIIGLVIIFFLTRKIKLFKWIEHDSN
jgi:hypothetical protein